MEIENYTLITLSPYKSKARRMAGFTFLFLICCWLFNYFTSIPYRNRSQIFFC